ncbi:uncharacterized protein LOC109714595 [Ananas comosus]|uniref:Uncharacterized protein LOC109714595 n=1 Tax=Ananas comosus TaxID=4615 RepID=A0A6P5FG13_ANACO|nr:uncharacterized protein LOC109714595 [Ananas comosus]
MGRMDLEVVALEVPSMLAGLIVQTTLLEKIKSLQPADSNLQKVRLDIEGECSGDFTIDTDGMLRYRNRWCVPENKEVRKLILQEAHRSPYSVHPGETKMYQDLKMHYWWLGMKADIGRYVAQCLVCQQVKAECRFSEGKLQSLPVPVWKWEDISMDFVVRLPCSMGGHDAIWVVVDRLTKLVSDVGERAVLDPDVLREAEEKVRLARQRLLTAQSRQKSYADKCRRDLEFAVGDPVFLKVSPMRDVKRFGVREKLSPRYIGPYEVLEQIGAVAYRLALPPKLAKVHNVFHVSNLRKNVET